MLREDRDTVSSLGRHHDRLRRRRGFYLSGEGWRGISVSENNMCKGLGMIKVMASLGNATLLKRAP